MAHTEKYETVIRLNTEQAKDEIDKIKKKIQDLRSERSRMDSLDTKAIEKINKEIEKEEKKLAMVEGRYQGIDRAIRNMSTAKPKELRNTIRQINDLLNSGHVERGSAEWKVLTAAMKEAKTELAKIGAETKASQPFLSRFFKFLNDSWGGIFVLVQSISGISTTIRKSVEDYAKMEEEMADVRKYTGMTADQVRDLNEEFKKMDTRTAREQLNQLAGSAGRLGLQSKKDIMEFVEAADMIGVALGDDLGDGAVDKIGKLAMAFGEDEKKGLKGAMLSTGSALNELAQNSSAQAGYLVDFTARVAGFGKQLGLTQTQIMGFGTVMDENLLKDEMAATAFGNMLTKMQTDTAKFAKIAGKDVKEFSDLLRNDANAAILALADSLKKADPQTMMKMLDDMGLDGSRAVAVLATMADKIDDVRRHQERATKAYAEATSVQKEFDTMNNTVQARIDKCKKQFKEMSVELGERLLPVVKYTITGASMLAKTLSVLTGFVQDHLTAIVILSTQVGILTVMWKSHAVWLAIVDARNKVVAASTAALTAAQTLLRNAGVALHAMWALLTKGVQGYVVVMRAARLASLTNPWAALATVISVVGIAIYGAVKAWKSHSEAVRHNMQDIKEMRAQQALETDLNKKVSESIAEQKTKVEQLTRIIHSNAYTIGERRNAIQKLQAIIPDYHASISNEGKLYNDNSEAIRKYIQDLSDAALAEAIYQKKVEINQKKLELYFKQHRIENSLKAVQAYRDTQQQVTEELVYENGSVTRKQHKTKSAEESDRQQKIHEQRLADVKSETKVVEAEEKYIDEVLAKNKKAGELFNRKMTKTEGTTPSPGPTPPSGDYVSDDDKKKADALKMAEDAAKAEADARIAAKTHEYATGKIAYRQYIQDMAALQREGLEKRRDVYEKGSREYEKLNRQIEELDFKGSQEVNRMKLEDLQRCMLRQRAEIEAQAVREEITESEKQERLRLLNEAFLADKVELYREGSKERMDAEWELEETEQRNRLERERQYQQQLDQVRQQYLGMSNEKMLQTALDGLDKLHERGPIKKEEYQRALIAIRAQYAGTQSPSEQTRNTANDMLTNARNAAAPTESTSPIIGTIQNYQTLMEKLRELYGEDEENHEAYLLAKQQATSDFCGKLSQEMQLAYQKVNQVLQAASSYFSAQQEYETAQVQKKYDKQIEAAGNNQKKVKRLQEKQQKEEAAIKNKYNRRQMVVQMAQAGAQTAVNVIQAYGAGLSVGGVAAPIVAATFAAMALAAGMLQIATLKKQQQAQEAGYYEGGFTGGHRYRREAGVVHEGEFVANHQAVQNPAVLPFLNFLDQAQRNNTVGSLTAQDVSRSMGAGGSAQVVAPIVNIQSDNAELREALDRSSQVSERLDETLKDGIGVIWDMDEFDRRKRHYDKNRNRG